MSESRICKLKYNEESMNAAVTAVKGGKAIRAASKLYSVPRSTLCDKVKGRTQESRKLGRDPYLTKEEEISLVRWIEKCSRRGLPPHVNDIKNTVQNLIKEQKRITPFKNGRPGRHWFEAFKRRNPQISVRIPERVSKARVGVTEEDIRSWFQSLEDEMKILGLLNIFDDPSRIYNCDETNIQLCPLTARVVGLKAWKNVYELAPGPENSTLTFVGNFNARVDVVSPAIIYQYLRLPKDIAEAVPDEFLIGVSESGWMKSENFYEYIANGFIPWTKEHNITKPVIMFVDGHSTHLTLQVSVLCEDNDIILYLLPPNTTHILQPADVGVFKSLKQYWTTAVHEYQKENPNTVVRRINVAPLLKTVLNKIEPSVISNGFVACGLCPLDPDRVDYTKCLQIDIDKDAKDNIDVNMLVPSTSSTPDPHIFWDGKITYKKRKVPKEQLPAMISGSNDKESKKKKPMMSKSITDDWSCTYCQCTWNEGAKSKNRRKWMICFQCDGKMHQKCIPRKHLQDSTLSGGDTDSEIVFICEACVAHKV